MKIYRRSTEMDWGGDSDDVPLVDLDTGRHTRRPVWGMPNIDTQFRETEMRSHLAPCADRWPLPLIAHLRAFHALSVDQVLTIWKGEFACLLSCAS